MSCESKVLTIPTTTPFLRGLARAILNGDLPEPGGAKPDPLALSRMTILLPTRRAARALQRAFLDAGEGQALLLPRVRPIGEGDETGGLIRSLADPEMAGGAANIPLAIDPLERHLVLTSFVLAWSKASAAALESGPRAGSQTTPAQASHLAAGLIRLLDSVETEEVDLGGLAALVPDAFSSHWQHTLDFLKIVTEAWPGYLATRELATPARRRTLVLDQLADDFFRHPPAGPVIVAGVTGSIPATARLMKVIAGLPNGAVVLPGLDLDLADDAWAAISSDTPEHPQAVFRRTLDIIGVARADVETVRGAEAAGAIKDRTWFLGEALRPAATTDAWAALANSKAHERARAGLSGVSLIEAKSTDEEAEIVSLILRRAADDPALTAALISPDRLLARRVAARLASFGITVDDSAGRPFGKTPPGTLLDLTLQAVDSGFAPVAVMALLKHPLVRLGATVSETRRAARALELLALRQPYLGEGLQGLRVALDRALQAMHRDSGERPARALNSAARRLKADAVAAAADVLQRLEAAFAPILELGRDDCTLSELAAAHVATAEALAADENQDAGRLWAEEAGETAATFFAKLMDASIPGPAIPISAYPEFYRSLVTGLAVRERRPVHPRLSIWGPFESRLMQPGVVVLGGLNDGTWPEIADPDPWLSRPMLKALGLPSPEAQLGYAAHDFASLSGAPRVYLTRSLKVDGNPTVASRWLMRIEALAQGLGLEGVLRPPKEDAFADWAAHRDARAVIAEVNAPAPRPPLAARPRQMSVTRIEQWLANPYAIFAREILRLELLPELGAEPDAALRGQLIHDALNRFQSLHPADLPDDIAAVVEGLSNTVFREFVGHPRVAAFWRPRFRRFAEWFAETEPDRRAGISRVHSEVKGLAHILSPAGPFVLTARADRLDLSEAGRLTITDYKTGTPPADRKVVSGRAPQLALEAHIARSGGFAGLTALPIEALRYIKVSGGEPPGEARTVKCEDPSMLAREAAEGLLKLISLFDDPETPYQALRRPGFEDAYRFDDYRHLARTDEWAERGDE